MPIARCPRCDTQVRIDERDLGYDVECPRCCAAFPARPDTAEPPVVHRAGDRFDRPRYDAPPRDEEDDEYDQPRPRRRRRDEEEDYASPEEVVADARRAVFTPALFSVLVAIATILYHIVDTALLVLNPQLLKNNPFGGGANVPIEAIVAVKILMLIWQLVIIAGSFAMMRLKSRGFALATMVMQIIPGGGVCCILALPIGIWGSVVLNRPDVRDAFEIVRDGKNDVDR